MPAHPSTGSARWAVRAAPVEGEVDGGGLVRLIVADVLSGTCRSLGDGQTGSHARVARSQSGTATHAAVVTRSSPPSKRGNTMRGGTLAEAPATNPLPGGCPLACRDTKTEQTSPRGPGEVRPRLVSLLWS
jgi:hypothetical protein